MSFFELLGKDDCGVQALTNGGSDSQRTCSLNLRWVPAHVVRVRPRAARPRILALKFMVCHELPLVVRHETLVVLYKINAKGWSARLIFC